MVPGWHIAPGQAVTGLGRAPQQVPVYADAYPADVAIPIRGRCQDGDVGGGIECAAIR